MTTPPGAAAGSAPRKSERQSISCPGCGRHDYVMWPASQESYAWKCFNCEKEFVLHRGGRH